MIQESGADRIVLIKHDIASLIVDLDEDRCINPSRRRWMTDALSDLILAAVTKFIEGQREHGDNFEEIDGPTEALKEFVDTFFYLRKCTHPISLYDKSITPE